MSPFTSIEFYNFSKTFKYESDNEIEITLRPGKYKIECWGAQGTIFSQNIVGGKGAYVKGVIYLTRMTKFYLYIGEKGKPGNSYQESFNGGGKGQTGGGGATNIRYVGGQWSDFDSLKTRIMVAAGGGGPDSSLKGGAGGKLEGLQGEKSHGDGGKQTQGGIGCNNGTFGKGGGSFSEDGNGGGGSGYYGGANDDDCHRYSGGGGSSFISGYYGCDAIKESSTEGNIIHSGQSIHYSGYFFKEAIMLSGEEIMPSPDGGTETGHSDSGAIRITSLGGFVHCSKFSKTNRICSIYYYIIILCKS